MPWGVPLPLPELGVPDASVPLPVVPVVPVVPVEPLVPVPLVPVVPVPLVPLVPVEPLVPEVSLPGLIDPEPDDSVVPVAPLPVSELLPVFCRQPTVPKVKAAVARSAVMPALTLLVFIVV